MISRQAFENKRSCFFCNGFYGPTHGEYICGTCHLFLYADDRHADLASSAVVVDENDSGNDEPSEGQLSSERYVRALSQQNHMSMNINIQRSLHQRINELSIGCAVSDRVHEDDAGTNESVDYFARLPPEVFLIIFRHLDTLSLWSLSIASPCLYNLIHAHMPDDKWRDKIQRCWPLYKPYFNESWYLRFSKLVISSPCKSCLFKMMNESDGVTAFNATEINNIDNSRRLKRLGHEVKIMKNEPPEGVNAVPIDDNFLHWCASIQGPVNSPYEGGIFYLYMQVPYIYPLHPPKVHFITRIFHPNVSRHGDIGLDCIAHNWSLALTIAKILISIQSLLTDPYCKISMEPVIAELYENDRNAFNRKATEWTYKYAMNDILPMGSYESDGE